MKEEAVGQDREEWGETFDRVYEGNGDFRGCCRGENVTANLEKGEWERGSNDLACRRANPVFEGGDRSAEGWKEVGTIGEEDTPARDESELDQGEGNGFGKGIEDRFRGGVCQGGAEIPDQAKNLRLDVSAMY